MYLSEIEKSRLCSILESTKTLSFPLISSKDKKSELFENKKKDLDTQIRIVLTDNSQALRLFESKRVEIWDNSELTASEQFKTLPAKLRFNSFYFEEVMHEYVEEIMTALTKED